MSQGGGPVDPRPIVSRETQQIIDRGFAVMDALRRGEITSTQANRLSKVLREWERSLKRR